MRVVPERVRLWRRPSRRLRLALSACAAVVLLAGGLSGATASAFTDPPCLAGGDHIRPCIPPGPDPTDPTVFHGSTDFGAYAGGSTFAQKAKTKIALAIQLQHFYANETFKLTVVSPKETLLNSVQPSWVQTTTGPNPTYGLFTPTQVATLAFGVLPTKATVQLTQTKGANGLWNPLVINTQVRTVTRGNVVTNTNTGALTGQVALSISGVSVDGVPLDVGPSCRASVPIALNLHSVGDYQALGPGGELAGDVTIPAFSGCVNGTENLDPIVTGLFSGPGNTIDIRQGNGVPWDPATGTCPDCVPPKLP